VPASMPGPAATTARARWTGEGHVAAPANVDRILAGIAALAGDRRNTAEALRSVTTVGADGAGQAATGYVPVPSPLAALLPWPGGLRRGATIVATGARSLLLALLGGATTGDGWAAVVGMPDLGLLAAAEQQVPLDRVALVPNPGVDWPRVVGALLDGFDLVVVATPGEVTAGTTRALTARARSRGAVLVPTRPWPGADLVLTATAHSHVGLGEGHGRIEGYQLTVRAEGRGSAARPRDVTLPVPFARTGNLQAHPTRRTADLASNRRPASVPA
jgi:hypothetical protein